MSNTRPIQTARVRIGSPSDATAHAAMRAGSRVNASLFGENHWDLANWYLVQSRTELNPREVLYTLKSCDAPPAVAPTAPPEPTMADLMREIQVLQRMVASMAQCAHGAPLVVRHGE